MSASFESARKSEELEQVIIETDGRLGVITLNRHDALNALTLEMIREISGALTRWQEDENIGAVLIHAGEGRAFCAGGDIKAAYRLGMRYRRGDASESTLTLFFEEEYAFNSQLFHYKKPIIVLMDGITMGGGFELAGPCSYRIATDRTLFAMPEVAIGFFPDVGSMYFLNNCPDESGCYLAVTGHTVSGADMFYAGLAESFIPETTHEDIQSALVKALPVGADVSACHDAVKDLLAGMHKAPKAEGLLVRHKDLIRKAFGKNSIEEIVQVLEEASADDDFAKDTLALIDKRSPLSVKLALHYYRWAQGQAFDKILEQDLHLAAMFLKHHDFYEGVRAMVIDKDRNPAWDPAHLESVDEDVIRHYMAKH